ncbi:hypothetical protein H6P81_020796 [Aristolochia fimbriata]|uniref:EVE domain-containing protein n=1 Tax=Aristolochia fimbriata TaxID=158543 RepID=A0AAV7DWL2_ARIFI|nr:hypothetical protein H6P81_020796 [Aristolochia fimbriata]
MPKTQKKRQRRELRREEIRTSSGDRRFWLLKTEPGEWSWADQASNGGVSKWDGVKNKQALKYMKAMKAGDLCFFYHSGAKDRRVVGVVAVAKELYCCGGGGVDDDEGAVDVRGVGEMGRPVELKEIKEEEGMGDFALVKQPRLSVVPVPEKIWDRICEMGGGYGGKSGEDGAKD